MSEPRLQGRPTNWQKSRLEDFLTELMLLSRKYKVLLHQEGLDLRFIDTETHTIIGLDLSVVADPETHVVYQYLAANSITDPGWFEGESGLREIDKPE